MLCAATSASLTSYAYAVCPLSIPLSIPLFALSPQYEARAVEAARTLRTTGLSAAQHHIARVIAGGAAALRWGLTRIELLLRKTAVRKKRGARRKKMACAVRMEEGMEGMEGKESSSSSSVALDDKYDDDVVEYVVQPTTS